jgi:uncharacterized protein YndB with AHSA1/START domain
VGVLDCSVWIGATPEQVWRTYVDPARIPEWQTGKPVVLDVEGAPGRPGSTYVSKRGPLSARTTVLAADGPRELVTMTEAYLGLEFEVTSRLTDRSGGTDLRLHVQTRWRRPLAPIAKLVELAVLSPREADRELALLKALVEREARSSAG